MRRKHQTINFYIVRNANFKSYNGYFIMKSGQTEITQWAIPLWEVKKVILHSEIFDLRIGKSVIAE